MPSESNTLASYITYILKKQLLKLRGGDDPKVFDWISRKSSKYTSPEIQNEMLKQWHYIFFRILILPTAFIALPISL